MQSRHTDSKNKLSTQAEDFLSKFQVSLYVNPKLTGKKKDANTWDSSNFQNYQFQ